MLGKFSESQSRVFSQRILAPLLGDNRSILQLQLLWGPERGMNGSDEVRAAKSQKSRTLKEGDCQMKKKNKSNSQQNNSLGNGWKMSIY